MAGEHLYNIVNTLIPSQTELPVLSQQAQLWHVIWSDRYEWGERSAASIRSKARRLFMCDLVATLNIDWVWCVFGAITIARWKQHRLCEQRPPKGRKTIFRQMARQTRARELDDCGTREHSNPWTRAAAGRQEELLVDEKHQWWRQRLSLYGRSLRAERNNNININHELKFLPMYVNFSIVS